MFFFSRGSDKKRIWKKQLLIKDCGIVRMEYVVYVQRRRNSVHPNVRRRVKENETKKKQQRKSIGAHMKCRDNDIRFVDVSLPFVVCLLQLFSLSLCYFFRSIVVVVHYNFFLSLLLLFYLVSCAYSFLIQTLRDNMHLIKSHTQCSCYVSAAHSLRVFTSQHSGSFSKMRSALEMHTHVRAIRFSFAPSRSLSPALSLFLSL